VVNEYESASVLVTITNPAPVGGAPAAAVNALYRRKVGDGDWKLIEPSAPVSYHDYTCARGDYEYAVTASSASGSTSAMTIVQVSSWFSGQWLIDEADPGNNVNFLYNSNSNTMRGQGWAGFTETNSKYPRKHIGLPRYNTGTLSAMFIKNNKTVREMIQQLERMEQSTRVYLLKLDDGGIFRVQFVPFESSTSHGGAYGDVNLEWTAVDEAE
jgi:hypothetical protein